MLKVVAVSRWPRRLLMVAMGTPPSPRTVATKWRRSWRRMVPRPSSARSRPKRLVQTSVRHRRPSASVRGRRRRQAERRWLVLVRPYGPGGCGARRSFCHRGRPGGPGGLGVAAGAAHGPLDIAALAVGAAPDEDLQPPAVGPSLCRCPRIAMPPGALGPFGLQGRAIAGRNLGRRPVTWDFGALGGTRTPPTF